MTTRFHPRQAKSRNDAMAAPSHLFQRSGNRQEASRRDGYAQELGAEGNNPFVNGTVAVTGGNSLGVKSIVAGGSQLLFTLTSSQDRWDFPDVNTINEIQAGLGSSAGFNPGSIGFALTTANFSVDVTGLLLNVTLPAVAAYSPGAGTALNWNFPRSAFKNSPVAINVASALVVTSAA